MADQNTESRPSQDQPSQNTTGFPQLAKVVGHTDATYSGKLLVELLRPSGNSRDSGQVQQVKMISPFFGYTSTDYLGEEDDFNSTQKSYGMWMVPPDVGTIVVVIFINGDAKDGYWIGGVPTGDMNFMTPGLASTSFAVEDTKLTDKERVPVAEFNKTVNEQPGLDTTKIPKAAHPFETVLNEQGLLEDDIRGITTSSARRETPSAVFGISTPGPLDKQDGATKGKIGTKGKEVNAFVSRLGGTTFVMDDGDDKFLRKTLATDGPPDYVSVEQDGPDGSEPTIPHNELIRFRTRTGHQILLHNSEDLIYIGNGRGTAWIELSSDGKIDIFAEDSISIRTKQDFNFYADRDINFEAKRNVNLKSGARFQTDVGSNYNLVVTGNGKITTTGALDVKTDGANKFTSGGDTLILAANTAIDGGNINLNSGVASSATAAVKLATHEIEDIELDAEAEVVSYKIAETPITSILKRIPTHEPWPHHENLDPLAVKFEKTDREIASAIPEPEWYKKYTTITDTFAKVAGEEEEPTEGEEE